MVILYFNFVVTASLSLVHLGPRCTAWWERNSKGLDHVRFVKVLTVGCGDLNGHVRVVQNVVVGCNVGFILAVIVERGQNINERGSISGVPRRVCDRVIDVGDGLD